MRTVWLVVKAEGNMDEDNRLVVRAEDNKVEDSMAGGQGWGQ